MQRDDGALGPLGKCNKSDDHHSYAGDKGTTDYTAETILACFPEDRSGAELGTCSLTKDMPHVGRHPSCTPGVPLQLSKTEPGH